MGFNNSSDNGDSVQSQSSTNLAIFSTVVVLTVLWCLVFLLVFIICLFLLKTRDEVTNADVSLNEVSEKTKKRENHKSYKERVNSVYYEWFRDSSPPRKHINSETYEMVEMS